MTAGTVAQAATGAALGVAAIQVSDGVPVPDWVLSWAELLVVALIGIVWWSVRKINADHERRITEIERKENRDVERLRDSISDLRVTIAELRAVCPFCTPGQRRGGDGGTD